MRRVRRFRLMLGLMAVSMPAAVHAGGSAMAAPLDPGTRLCLHPLRLPIAHSEEDPRTQRFQAKLVDALTTAGFEVAAPASVDALVERVVEESGSVVDPYTGRRDPLRYDARRSALAQALRAELGCKARMFVHVELVYAFYIGGVASWDGTTERVSSAGRIALQVLAATPESGFMRALSLWLRVSDLEGNQIAFRSAGIETLVDMGLETDLDLLAEDQWLTDEEKIDDAIRSALGVHGVALRRAGDPHRSAAAQ